MTIIKQYLLDENKKIIENIENLQTHLSNSNIVNNKLIQKKIEYINFYMKNINEELIDINNICNSNLFLDEEYINSEYNKYLNMEITINKFQLTHNL